MDGMSNGNNKRGDSKIGGILIRTIILTVLLQSYAYPQCNLPAPAWLDKLTNVETGDFPTDQKIAALSRLIKDFEKCGLRKDSVYARIVHRLGDYYRINGDFDRGISYAVKAVSINRQEHPGSQPSYLTHSYYNLALYHNLLGLTEEAHLYYDSCLAVGYQFPEKMFIVLMALEKKAFLYFQTGDYEESIRVADQGIVLSRSQDLRGYEALLLIQKAQSEAEIGRIDRASSDISGAIKTLNENDLALYLPNAYSVLANVLSRKKEYADAIAYYKKAVELNLAQGNNSQAARDLHDLALLYDRELKDFNNATSYYEQALKVLDTLQDPYMLAATYNNLGQVCWRNNDFRKALHFYQKGLIALPVQFSDENAEHNPDPAKLKAVTNEYISAALLWNKGDAWLGLFNQNPDVTFLKHAVASYRRGDRMVDHMRWNQHGEQSKLFWREKTKRWYAKAIEASFLLNDADAVFYFMEKSRAVLLNDKLAELGAKNQLTRTEADTEKRLRVKYQSLLAVSSSSDPQSFDDLWQAQRNLNNFIEKLEKRYPSYYSYKYDTAVSSVKDVQKNLLSEDHAWVELFTDHDTIYTLTIESDTAVLKKIYFTDHGQIARQITDLCSSRNSINSNFKQYHKLAYHYYKTLFKPLDIKATRVTISHDEYFFPFDLLQRDSIDQTGFLVRSHAFSYAYSATHTLKSKLNYSGRNESLLAIAPIHYEPHLNMQTLNGAGESLEKIQTYYKSGVLLTGDAATKRSFLRQIPGFNIIHLYSHAKADSLGAEPAIYFYDSALNLSELQDLTDLNTQLIVLFACNSGVGKTVKGEGIFSLARGFAAAGIPSTVSAIWEIDNKATYNIAELFFSELANGEPSDIALQQAKLKMISNYDREYELPYYWAGAVLIGKTDMYNATDDAFLSQNNFLLLALSTLLAAFLLFVMSHRKIGKQFARRF